MNAITRAYQPHASASPWFNRLSYRHVLPFFILVLTIFISAVGVVYMKDLNRRLFIQYQGLQQEQQQAQVRWGQLLLEESAWSTQARVQHLARTRLNMVLPSRHQTQLINLTP